MWDYSESNQYDPEMRSGEIFTGYINMLLNSKQEASGWLSWIITEDQKEEYLYDYLKKNLF